MRLIIAIAIAVISTTGCTGSNIVSADSQNADNTNKNGNYITPQENVSSEATQTGTSKQLHQPSSQTEVKGYNFQNSEKAEIIK